MIYGGNQKRPQIHIDDLTDYFLNLIVIPDENILSKVYNAGGQNITIMEIAHSIKKLMGSELELIVELPRSDERTYHVSSDKLLKELGLKPKKTILDAIKEIQITFKTGIWTNPDDDIYHNVYRMKNLGIGKNLLL